MIEYPEKISDETLLEELISRPTAETIQLFGQLEGDIILLGISGKIGPSLARMAKRASEAAGCNKRVIGVSRFHTECESKQIEHYGIEVIRGDLLEQNFINSLPKVRNVFFLAGMKFGAEENLSLTWAINTYLPALVAEHFKDSRIVVFSSGCVYPLVRVNSGGSKETDRPIPSGEYAQSCLGRERMFEYSSLKNNTSVALIRLNYSVEPRYGVLTDIAIKVKNQEIIDLSMGYFNVIWQGDVNNVVLRSLEQCESPAKTLNITGPEILSVREVASEFGKLFGIKPRFINDESDTALLNNSEKAYTLFGKPKVPANQVLKWIADWIIDGKMLLGKPTHFEVRNGKY
jgi:dTDP-4-dehydrorhamnose reductase